MLVWETSQPANIITLTGCFFNQLKVDSSQSQITDPSHNSKITKTNANTGCGDVNHSYNIILMICTEATDGFVQSRTILHKSWSTHVCWSINAVQHLPTIFLSIFFLSQQISKPSNGGLGLDECLLIELKFQWIHKWSNISLVFCAWLLTQYPKKSKKGQKFLAIYQHSLRNRLVNLSNFSQPWI